MRAQSDLMDCPVDCRESERQCVHGGPQRQRQVSRRQQTCVPLLLLLRTCGAASLCCCCANRSSGDCVGDESSFISGGEGNCDISVTLSCCLGKAHVSFSQIVSQQETRRIHLAVVVCVGVRVCVCVGGWVGGCACVCVCVCVCEHISDGKPVKISVMIGTLLYLLGTCARHSKLAQEMYIALRSIPKEDTLRR